MGFPALNVPFLPTSISIKVNAVNAFRKLKHLTLQTGSAYTLHHPLFLIFQAPTYFSMVTIQHYNPIQLQ